MDDLLDAFQYLQSENLAATSLLAAQQRLTATELRVLMILTRIPGASVTMVADIIEYSAAAGLELMSRLNGLGYLESVPKSAPLETAPLVLTARGAAVTQDIRDFYRTAFVEGVARAQLADVAMSLRDLADGIRARRMPYEARSTSR